MENLPTAPVQERARLPAPGPGPATAKSNLETLLWGENRNNERNIKIQIRYKTQRYPMHLQTYEKH
jgi:hypothetical protein